MNAESLNLLEETLIRRMGEMGRVAVAFSGGVDSAVVAKASYMAMGEGAIAVTSVSASLALGELELAQSTARQIGIRHVCVETNEFLRKEYVANAPSRCFYCKSELYERLNGLKDELKFDVIANGANCDDVGDHRPGMEAAWKMGVRSPLIEAGFNKVSVRSLAEKWGLPVWNKPASPCLSSRVAYGVAVTPERVAKIDAAERFLRDEFNLPTLRVRLEENELARIEVPLDALPRLAEPSTRVRVVRYLRTLGFRYVTLDLEGFRSGSLNSVLTKDDLVTLKMS